MPHENHDKWLCDLLHGNVPEIPRATDLIGWWRSYPPEACDPNHPEYFDRMEWLVAFIGLTHWHH